MSAPITVIKLYRSKLPHNGTDVLDEGAYVEMLASAPSFTVTGCTFQRQTRQIRVPLSMDSAGRYNYVTWQNNGQTYGAYITDMEYRNDNMTVVTYELDAWHTYINSVNIAPCMVSRMTIPKSQDIVGDWLEPEPISPTTAKYFYQNAKLFENMRVIVATTRKTDGSPAARDTLYNNIYSGAAIYNYTPEEAGAFIRTMIDANYQDAICGVWMCPQEFVGTAQEPTGTPSHVTMDVGERPTTIDGYTPKNNKLFTSQFITLHITSSNGEARDYGYEYFPAVKPQFAIYGAIGAGASAMLTPIRYANNSGRTQGQFALSIEFPQGSWSADTFTAWLQANAATLGIQGASAAIGLLSGTPASILSGVEVGATALVNVVNASRNSFTIEGSVKSDVLSGKKELGFIAYTKTPTAEDAEMIDNFLTKYGYAVNRFAIIPTGFKNRSNFDYYQTDGAAVFVPDAPAVVEQEISSMFDSGIRIWHSYGSFLDYSISND